MIDRLASIAEFYAEYFTSIATDYDDFAMIFGWAATASLLVAVTIGLFALFKRERGKDAAVAIGQHVLVFIVPYLFAMAS